MGAADYEDLRYDVADHVATVMFARPTQLNAFRAETMREFLDVLDRVDADDDVRAVVVTGRAARSARAPTSPAARRRSSRRRRSRAARFRVTAAASSRCASMR